MAPPVIGYPYLITGGALVTLYSWYNRAPPVIRLPYLITGGAIVTRYYRLLGYYGSASNRISLPYYWRSHSNLAIQVTMAPPVIG